MIVQNFRDSHVAQRDKRFADVQHFLDDLARAVHDNDQPRLAELFDPSADPQAVKWARSIAASVQALPLRDWGLELVAEQPGTDSRAARELGAQQVWSPLVYVRFAVGDIDPAPTRKKVRLELVQREDVWRLRGPGDAEPQLQAPWAFGPLVVREVPQDARGTSLVVGHPDQQQAIDKLAGALGPSMDTIAGLVGGPAAMPAVLVVVTSSRDEFAAMVGEQLTDSDAAAVAISDAVIPGQPVTGQRIVFNPLATQRLSDEMLVARLRHELVHVATRAQRVSVGPMWVAEGFAEYGALHGSTRPFALLAPTLANAIGRGFLPEGLPADHEFLTKAPQSALPYETAWSLYEFLASQFGDGAVVAFYDWIAETPVVDPVAAAAAVDAAFLDATGLTTADVVARWRGWLLLQVGE